MRNRTCQVENSLCLTGQKIKQTSKKLVSKLFLPVQCLVTQNLSRAARNFHLKCELGVFFWFQGCAKHPQFAFGVQFRRIQSTLSQFYLLGLWVELWSDVLFSFVPTPFRALPKRSCDFQLLCQCKWRKSGAGCQAPWDAVKSAPAEAEKCLRIRMLWLLIARLQGPSESNKIPCSISAQWKAVPYRVAESGTWSRLVQPLRGPGIFPSSSQM